MLRDNLPLNNIIHKNIIIGHNCNLYAQCRMSPAFLWNNWKNQALHLRKYYICNIITWEGYVCVWVNKQDFWGSRRGGDLGSTMGERKQDPCYISHQFFQVYFSIRCDIYWTTIGFVRSWVHVQKKRSTGVWKDVTSFQCCSISSLVTGVIHGIHQADVNLWLKLKYVP